MNNREGLHFAADEQKRGSDYTPKKAFIRPEDDKKQTGMHTEALLNDDLDGHNQSRSNAYEVALIDKSGGAGQHGTFFLDEILTNEDEVHQQAPTMQREAANLIEAAPLVIKIDLGGENYASITAFKNSNPLELATNFCQFHKLPDAIIEPLCYRIRTNIRTHFEKKAKLSSQFNNYANKQKLP